MATLDEWFNNAFPFKYVLGRIKGNEKRMIIWNVNGRESTEIWLGGKPPLTINRQEDNFYGPPSQ